MNNKGFTLVELIVSIVLITIIIVPIFTITINFRNREHIASDKAQLLEYKNTLTYDIQKDILDKGLKTFTENTTCSVKECFILTFQDDSKKHLNLDEKEVVYNDKSYPIVIEDAKIAYDDYNIYDDIIKENDNYIYFEIPIEYMESDTSKANYNVRIIAKKAS